VCVCFSLQIVKLKAEARLDLLRQVGVAVDTWLKSAMNQVLCVCLSVLICFYMCVYVFAYVCRCALMYVPVCM